MKHFTMDSFEAELPNNWEEIADWLNDYAELIHVPDDDSQERYEQIERIWEDYCNGNLAGAPKAK